MISSAEKLARLMPSAACIESEEPEMESSQHHSQAVILEKSLEFLWQDRNDFFIGVNLTVYFSRQQLKTHDFRGPDVFISLNTERRPRYSWVIWEEDGKYPDVIFELLSESTEDIDRTIKKSIYQDRFRTSEYYWFSPQSFEFAGFHLVDGQYEEMLPNEQGWLWSKKLHLYLGVLDGRLRYFKPSGELVPTPEEAAIQEQMRADEERMRADEERMRADEERRQARREQLRAQQAEQKVAALAARLLELGVDPNTL
ncbi:MAG: Uma2 family endonuclease [Acidobacteriota bacterium]